MERRNLYVDNIKIDLERRTIEVDGTTAGVTSHEFYIIECLLDNVNKIVPRATIQKAAWGCELGASSRALDAHIFRIRAKLRLDENKSMKIIAAYASGYRLLLDDAVMSGAKLGGRESITQSAAACLVNSRVDGTSGTGGPARIA
ncbi:transcriptional regulator [Burkholderia sp. Nafp2/4-1b]|uniref:winged helix-turn-helix domain-containing protein n=1 Tax=Burkholderia sp. Nafp2/4-1b TaxID=2116686 RepID=UPI000EF947B4|nr:winged helix-turn-helix domain-containing protein [Burkholderia sp. Nafp2/4-1b]RKT98667.1 transcriptional regulator [Burkholderia sp. Nafp2/4-1b]